MYLVPKTDWATLTQIVKQLSSDRIVKHFKGSKLERRCINVSPFTITTEEMEIPIGYLKSSDKHCICGQKCFLRESFYCNYYKSVGEDDHCLYFIVSSITLVCRWVEMTR